MHTKRTAGHQCGAAPVLHPLSRGIPTLRASGPRPTILEVVMAAERYQWTGVFPEDQPAMVGYHWAWIDAMTNRAIVLGYLECGVSRSTAWLLPKGRRLLSTDAP